MNVRQVSEAIPEEFRSELDFLAGDEPVELSVLDVHNSGTTLRLLVAISVTIQ